MNTRRTVVAALAGGAALAAAGGARAQAYPSKPITMLLPLTVGSAGDVALRLVAQRMSERMGQPIVIENQPGAAGLVGTERIARAAPDGYLLGGVGDSIVNFAANLAPKLNFDPVEGLQPVGLVANIPWVLAVHSGFRAKTLSAFVAAAKAEPGRIDYASTGMGSASHIGMEMFAAQAGIRMNHVPYKGATPAANDVAGGQVAAVFAAVSVVLPHIKAGRMVALGVPAERRSALLPEAPTFAEAGLPGFDFVTWVGLVAPRGTPRAAVDRINAELANALQDASIRERLLTQGLEPATSTPEQLGERLRTGHARVAKIIRDNNIKAE
jgi:tripartite-type tricarboxylate transporter receptor subunit TctC